MKLNALERAALFRMIDPSLPWYADRRPATYQLRRKLLRLGFVDTYVADPNTPGKRAPRWRITDAGRAYLAETRPLRIVKAGT